MSFDADEQNYAIKTQAYCHNFLLEYTTLSTHFKYLQYFFRKYFNRTHDRQKYIESLILQNSINLSFIILIWIMSLVSSIKNYASLIACNTILKLSPPIATRVSCEGLPRSVEDGCSPPDLLACDVHLILIL